jgi:hypothetical protein
MVWKRPVVEIRHLFETGVQALRRFNRRQPSETPHEEIERLERVLDQLAAADDWTQRLHTFWSSLRTERARIALTTLVRLGCVPHELVDVVGLLTDPRAAKAMEDRRRETAAYFLRLQRLAASFTRLADDCDKYTRLPWRYDQTKFRLDRYVAAFLRDEATTMRAFMRDTDPRRFTNWGASHYRMRMMHDIKIMTGRFQDALLAQFLSGVPGVTMTAAQLRKMRTRQTKRAAAWAPPPYFNRPGSRIVMNPHSETKE